MGILPLAALPERAHGVVEGGLVARAEGDGRRARARGLWVDPARLLALIDGPALAVWALGMALLARGLSQRGLPPPRHAGGAPRRYGDAAILLTLLVMRAWRLSLEKMADWLGRDAALAAALGYAPGGPTISAAQLSRRGRRLGLWPFLFFFLGLAWQLVRAGAVSGRELILDASLLRAWYRRDPGADLAGRRGGRATFGYKIHAVVDRWTHLPLLFVLTPASAHEAPLAPALLLTAVLLYGLRVAVVYADSAYFSRAFLRLIRWLGASPVVDYNLRRAGKRFLATLFFTDQWRRLRGPRTAVERCFAFLKRYYGLKYFQVQGAEAVWQYALLVHAAMLAVALAAYRSGRTDLMTSRAQVLAFAFN
jgi:hypothetical protein